MKRVVLVVITVIAVILMLVPVSLFAAPRLPDYRPVDAGVRIRAMEPTRENIKGLPADALAGVASAAAVPSCSTATKTFLTLNDYTGSYFFTNFYLLAEGPGAQIWVQANLSWPTGDPRPAPVITCEQAQYMLGQFQDNIYPKEIDFFGPPDFLDGSTSLLEAWGYFPPGYYADTAGRQIVLVANVRDANYYDPLYPIYIAGFYSSSLEAYFGRNTMTIDAYDWANRTGPTSKRPYLYEGVFAHEYQHLLHDDYDPAEENWINEGLADWAMQLTGYNAAIGHLEDLIDMPENSLVVWGDQGDLEILADYGIAYLYQEFMYEHFGETFIQNEFRDGVYQGIASVNAVLAGMGSDETFADTFHQFAPAMYTKGAFTQSQLTNFQVNVGGPGRRNPQAYGTPGAPPWGADFYLLWGYEQIANFQFNGYQFNPLSWTSDGAALWSGAGDLIDNWAIFEAPGGGTLTFDTKFNIEWSWDYGFVQVSTDGGSTWTSLANADTCNMVDPSAHPKVVANLPGFTGMSGLACAEPTSGDAPTWINTSFDLSPYASQDILIAFRYVTDWATTYDGWYVKNVRVDGNLISDGSSTSAFKSLNQVLSISNDYTVQLIGQRVRAGKPEYEVKTIMSGGYASDWTSIRQMFNNYSSLVLVVTYDAPQGVSSYADYTFSIDHRGGIHLK